MRGSYQGGPLPCNDRVPALALRTLPTMLPRIVREPSFPGAVPPERTRAIESFGVRLNLLEWGDPEAQPVVLTHGMWDHARSFAVLAPLLARRFRVVAVDARGHGDSGWAAAYTWLVDVLDIVNVLRLLGRRAHLIGHSKGGGQATDAARAAPDLVMRLVNIDGFGPPALPDGDQPTAVRCAAFLDGGEGCASLGARMRPWTTWSNAAVPRTRA